MRKRIFLTFALLFGAAIALYFSLGMFFGLVVMSFVILRIISTEGDTSATLDHVDGHQQLVIIVHGLGGYNSLDHTADLVREALPGADILRLDYDAGPLSNVSPYTIANVLELEVHKAHKQHNYREIILVGHSLGGMVTRKAFLWGHGLEEDRERFGRRGKRMWVDNVSRFVSLASVNRGWSIEPRPQKMRSGIYWGIWIGEKLIRLIGVGNLVLEVQRGAPFIADSRVQWIRLFRRDAETPLPTTIHLLGDEDDIVSRADSMDIAAAKDTVFVTLAQTGHVDIARALKGDESSPAHQRRLAIRAAITGDLNSLDAERPTEIYEDNSVHRIVYLMHGIRDYGDWTDRLRQNIEARAEDAPQKIAVVNKKYGYFPMLPFLLYSDRQENVRRFMDEYTENLAHYPAANLFDFVGHSNGTYILAGALQRYSTLKIERVYFAGSVVPQHYPWRALINQGRVKEVINVVASGDWVVALFPRFFEQIADWTGTTPVRGMLDIGSAGFRGFQDSQDPLGRVRNIKFAEGQHGTGVDADNQAKLDAIANYIIDGNYDGLTVFTDAKAPWSWLSILSNISWIVWVALAVIFSGIGWYLFKLKFLAGGIYFLILLALLNSV